MPHTEDRHSLTIIVIDDNPAVGFAMQAMLEIHGFESELYRDPREALERIRSNASKMLVITDFDMPYINGVGILHEIETKHPEVEAILVTAAPEEAQIETDLFPSEMPPCPPQPVSTGFSVLSAGFQPLAKRSVSGGGEREWVPDAVGGDREGGSWRGCRRQHGAGRLH